MKTRLRVRRVYKWQGEPLRFDRKLKNFEYGSLVISVEGLPRPNIINTGQCILIEGEEEDNPYVAQVNKLFGDESGRQKKAMVQWFVRASEVPVSKLPLLGREPHPQEIFYYQGRGCNEEVNAESILRPVQVKHLDGPAPFPDSNDKDVLYVKLSWDTKTFKMMDSAVLPPSTPPCCPKPCHPNSFPSSPPAAAPASRRANRRAISTPGTAVIQRAASADLRYAGDTMSTGKVGLEAESLHSATKLSASKCLSTKRRNAAARTPGVRKRLELCSPEKKSMPFSDVLSQLLDEELESEVELAQRLLASPPQVLHPTYSLTPRRKMHRAPADTDSLFQKPSVFMMNKLSACETDSPPSKTRAFSSMTEVDNENSPMLLVAATPRSSKRKSAQLVSTRIKKQFLLDDQQNKDSNTEDEEEFAPSNKTLCSRSEDDKLIHGDENVLVKEGRQVLAGSRVPRSKTTLSSTRTPRITPSKKAATNTPRTPATPIIPSRLMPARHPTNILEVARTRLHVSSVPESLPCREQEFQDIYSFVESKIIDGTGGCMYISGVPGTGKTATVHEVIRCLQNAANINEIPSFRFIEINGMKMTDPHQAYVQILEKLISQTATADHAASLLEKRFSNPAPRKETTVLLVDELDLLWTRKQNVMYNLFDWPTRRHSRLVVLTIANTMDLPERIMINRVSSRLGLARMSFQPYGFKQLQQIIMSRLNKVKAFEEDALQLVSRKVAALSGDARRCLDICRRATELCEHSAANTSITRLVGMSHVMDALDEMFSSSYITAIQSASVQEQLFLRAVIAEFRRLGLEEATFQQVFLQHQALCRVEGLQSIGVSEVLAVCQRLGACRLLLLETSRFGILQRVRLNVSQDDILYALKSD
ncbi:origin recognition complex subunit 1 isoform X2 [Phyllopteryx taeniolatus]|uniref:origin recognition complex subunit 1 isoform X2 n=1 Tax=Phyllopteryx taeniolatus TaxID=161469 RepID=UPI002AD36231|nr:origin recognition complex subunit 1 isoform X2 [Phyllopteryx taeniolatus]